MLQTKCPTCGNQHLTSRGAKYLRISEDREGEELGVTRQSEDLDELACKQDVYVIETYSDNDIGASTKSTKPRPDYDRMLADAKSRRFDVIMAYTSKRVTRRPRENEDLIELGEKFGTRFAYVRSPSFDLNTANGRMIARFLAAQDANESEEMAERVARAYAQRVMSGKNGGGGRKYGFEPDSVTKIDAECDEIEKWADAVLTGVTLRHLARDANERGVLTVRNGKHGWTGERIRSVLLRPRNAALLVYQGSIVENVKAPWKPIIKRETWEAVVRKLDDPDRKTNKGSSKPRWLLSGIAVCGHPNCAGKHHTLRVHGTYEDGSSAYRCTAGGHVKIPANELHDQVIARIIARLRKPDAVELIKTVPDVDVNALSREAEALRAKRVEYLEMFHDDIITKAELKAQLAKSDDAINELTSKMANVSDRDPLAGIAGRADAAEVWESFDLGRQREVIKRVMTVTVMPGKRGRLPGGGYFDSSRIKIEQFKL